jgi:DNA-binding CsgD family transcriptional regulator
METLKEIIAKRSAPGVLILDLEDRLLHSNQEALEMLSTLQGNDGKQTVPKDVYDLCGRLKGAKGAEAVFGVIRHPGGSDTAEFHFSVRAFLLGGHGEGDNPNHVMVLMEKISRNRQLDIEQARKKFQFSKRETQVVGLICQGLANKEISGAIFISEFTVKDHVKNIMRKMDTGSRNGIIASLL